MHASETKMDKKRTMKVPVKAVRQHEQRACIEGFKLMGAESGSRIFCWSKTVIQYLRCVAVDLVNSHFYNIIIDHDHYNTSNQRWNLIKSGLIKAKSTKNCTKWRIKAMQTPPTAKLRRSTESLWTRHASSKSAAREYFVRLTLSQNLRDYSLISAQSDFLSEEKALIRAVLV